MITPFRGRKGGASAGAPPPIHLGARQTHKGGEQPRDCQDAWWAGAHPPRVAVADGATRAFFAREWAWLVVERFCRDGRGGLAADLLRAHGWDGWPASLEGVRGAWRETVEQIIQRSRTRELLENRLKQKDPAVTTLVGLEFDGEAHAWRAALVGDSCLLRFCRDGTFLDSHPFRRPEQFDNHPQALISVAGNPRETAPPAPPPPVGAEEVLVLATDAAAKWLLSIQESDRFTAVRYLLGDDEDGFDARVAAARRGECEGAPPMEDDDVTLLVVAFGEPLPGTRPLREVVDSLPPPLSLQALGIAQPREAAGVPAEAPEPPAGATAAIFAPVPLGAGTAREGVHPGAAPAPDTDQGFGPAGEAPAAPGSPAQPVDIFAPAPPPLPVHAAASAQGGPASTAAMATVPAAADAGPGAGVAPVDADRAGTGQTPFAPPPPFARAEAHPTLAARTGETTLPPGGAPPSPSVPDGERTPADPARPAPGNGVHPHGEDPGEPFSPGRPGHASHVQNGNGPPGTDEARGRPGSRRWRVGAVGSGVIDRVARIGERPLAVLALTGWLLFLVTAATAFWTRDGGENGAGTPAGKGAESAQRVDTTRVRRDFAAASFDTLRVGWTIYRAPDPGAPLLELRNPLAVRVEGASGGWRKVGFDAWVASRSGPRVLAELDGTSARIEDGVNLRRSPRTGDAFVLGRLREQTSFPSRSVHPDSARPGWLPVRGSGFVRDSQ